MLLTRREIRARYKDSSLGLLWSFARPLAQFGVYYFALGKILGLSRQIPDFAIFVFIGLTGWMFFAEAVQKATTSIVSNAGLVKKVQLPREVFPLAATGSVVFMSAVQVVVLAVAIIAMGKYPAVGALPYAVAGGLVLITLAYAIGILFAALNVYYRDIEHLVEVVFVVLFWASPIVYAFSYVHRELGGNWIEQVYLANPVTIAILGLQRGLWEGGQEGQVWPEFFAWRLVLTLIFSLGVLAVAHRVFTRLEGDFAQEI